MAGTCSALIVAALLIGMIHCGLAAADGPPNSSIQPQNDSRVPIAQKGEVPQMRILTTKSGVRVGVLGNRTGKPAPTLLVFVMSIEDTLKHGAGYIKAGEILAEKGFLCACIDALAHGKYLLPGESGDSSEALTNWRKRIESGHTLVPEFVSRASSVIDYLIETGQTDPSKIAVCGTSRGGFLALHVAAADARVKCVAAFASVTNLLALREFGGMEKDKATNQLALRNVAGKLADRPVWIAIGNNDTRVGTDFAVELARKISQEAVARKAQPLVELHVVAAAGHALHATAHEEAAEWIAASIEP